MSRPPAAPHPQQPREAALFEAGVDGAIVEMNGRAAAILGARGGELCWEVVGGEVARRADAPCSPGCVRRLVEAGPARVLVHPVEIAGARYHLSCVPAGRGALCLLSPLSAAPSDAAGTRPSPREIDVLRALARGKTLEAVAQEIGIALTTVRTHVDRLRRKLGVATQASLVARAFERGYLP